MVSSLPFRTQSDGGHVLTFVDLAGAPSDFSHYVCWKKQHSVRVSRPMLGLKLCYVCMYVYSDREGLAATALHIILY